MAQCAEELLSDEYEELLETAIIEVSKRLSSTALSNPKRSIIQLGEAHGIIPLLISAEKRRYLQFSPEESKDLHNKAVHAAMLRLKMFSVIGELIAVFRECGVPYLMLKGLAFESLYYPTGMTRMQGDIDLMVAPSDIEEVAELLMTHPSNKTGAKSKVLSRSSHAITVLYNGMAIDLHTQLLEDRYSPLESWEKLYARRQTVHGTWGSVNTLSDEDSLHYMLAHGAKHHWCRLKWIMDLVWFISASTNSDLKRYVTNLKKARYSKVGSVGFGLANSFLAPLKAEEVKPYLPRTLSLRWLYASYNQDLFRERSGIGAKAQNALRAMLGSDSIYSAFKYALNRLMGRKRHF